MVNQLLIGLLSRFPFPYVPTRLHISRGTNISSWLCRVIFLAKQAFHPPRTKSKKPRLSKWLSGATNSHHGTLIGQKGESGHHCCGLPL
jgi:hypothetical protein